MNQGLYEAKIRHAAQELLKLLTHSDRRNDPYSEGDKFVKEIIHHKLRNPNFISELAMLVHYMNVRIIGKDNETK